MSINQPATKCALITTTTTTAVALAKCKFDGKKSNISCHRAEFTSATAFVWVIRQRALNQVAQS